MTKKTKTFIPLSYFDLLDACALPGCPVCRLAAKVVRSYLDSIMYERVNDPGVQAELRRSRGYCHAHAWELPEVSGGPALGVAILYRQIVRKALREIDHGTYVPPAWWSLRRLGEWLARFRPAEATAAVVRRLRPRAPCPACAHRDHMIDLALSTLVDALARRDEALQTALDSSGGLCLPHLCRALELTRDRTAFEILQALARRHLSRLEEELAEFIRKNDYRFQDESFGMEGDSWRRALGLMAGEE